MGTSQTGIEIFSGISAKINQSASKTLSSDSPVQLFVYNLNSSTTLKDMKFYFSIAGPVDSIFIPASEKKKNRGFAFVQMSNRKSAKRAEQILNNSWLDKHRIQIMALNNCIDFEMPRDPQIS
ncbi:MAG: hypothetical protein EZS28_033434 [Streblomastix strix]|uniref:RRM domain-containing protein n=1 Tax=Streblomastix strix TaxID=222440 RepID=A0A5J4UKL6_9EUKA|nr:MAG: hypothetical protein EZS28_033434 [Streblomastix strix]